MPNVSHQTCGAAVRQVLTDVYSRTCAAKNHANPMKDVKSDTLDTYGVSDTCSSKMGRADLAYRRDGGGPSRRFSPFEPVPS